MSLSFLGFCLLVCNMGGHSQVVDTTVALLHPHWMAHRLPPYSGVLQGPGASTEDDLLPPGLPQ